MKMCFIYTYTYPYIRIAFMEMAPSSSLEVGVSLIAIQWKWSSVCKMHKRPLQPMKSVGKRYRGASATTMNELIK